MTAHWLTFCRDPAATARRLGMSDPAPWPKCAAIFPSLSQRAFLEDVAKGPLERSDWGFGIHRPVTVYAAAMLGLVSIDWHRLESGRRRERASLTPMGRAVLDHLAREAAERKADRVAAEASLNSWRRDEHFLIAAE